MIENAEYQVARSRSMFQSLRREYIHVLFQPVADLRVGDGVLGLGVSLVLGADGATSVSASLFGGGWLGVAGLRLQ